MIDLDQMLDEEETLIQEQKDNLGTDTDNTDDQETSTETETESEDSDEVDDTAVAYFSLLKEEGILDVPDDFDFKGNLDSIKEAHTLTKKNLSTKVAQQIWSALPDDFKPLLEYGLNGGQSLQDYLDAVKTTDVENLDLEDDISRKAVIKSYYRILNPKLDDAQLNKRIDRLTEIADLEEEARDAIEYLRTHRQEQKDALVEKARQDQENQVAAFQKEIKQVSEIIDKTDDFDSNRKNRLKSFLLAPSQNNITGFESALDHIYENVEHKIQLANILADYDPKIGFNFEKLQKKLQKEATKSFKDLINSKLDPKTQTRGSSTVSKEDFDFSQWFGK